MKAVFHVYYFVVAVQEGEMVNESFLNGLADLFKATGGLGLIVLIILWLLRAKDSEYFVELKFGKKPISRTGTPKSLDRKLSNRRVK
jgi:hypothetical protein